MPTVNFYDFDDSYSIHLRKLDIMAERVGRFVLKARWEDVSEIPTTPFQRSMLAVIYLVAGIAFITYCLRMYSKINSKQIGLGNYILSCPSGSISNISQLTVARPCRGLASDCCYGKLVFSTTYRHRLLLK
jgi:hypothetical protein